MSFKETLLPENKNRDTSLLLNLKGSKESGLMTVYNENIFCCCSSSVTRACLTLCDPMDCSMTGLPVLHCLPEFGQIQLVMLSNHLILCQPFSPFAFNCFQHQALRIRWQKF